MEEGTSRSSDSEHLLGGRKETCVASALGLGGWSGGPLRHATWATWEAKIATRVSGGHSSASGSDVGSKGYTTIVAERRTGQGK